MTTIAHTVTARKPFTCEGYRCGKQVEPGHEYARHVAFPYEDEVNQGPDLWVLRICFACATEHGRPMPPRRVRSKRREVA